MCEAASSCEQLREMRLCGNDIADEGGTGVGDMLGTSTTLARLQLRYCNVGDAGSTALFNAISKSYTLEELNLSGNAITDSTARALASSLASTISLTRLNLADTGLQETGCRLLCEGAKASPIVELLMPFNQVTDKMVVSLAGYLRTSSKLTCLNLHSCGIEADGLLELAEGVRKGPMRKGILKLMGIDLSYVADQLPLPIREGVVWDTESILEDFRHQIEDREHGLSAGRPSTRGSRPPTRASADTEGDTSTHEGDGDEEQDTKDDASELAIPRALERLRAKDESFTKLLINRQSSMMASLSERAIVIAAKAEGEAQRAHIMDREPLLVVAKEKKRAMNRAEAALEAECIKIGELRALGAALQMTRLLTELKLFDCGIRASGCKVLCLGDRGEQDKSRVGLVNCVSLKILDLSFNALDDDGAEHLAQVLASKRCSALATVKLNRCGIHERGMLAIAIGARLGPLRAHPLVLFGVTLALVTPQLHLPNLAGGWNTQKLLAFFHHEHGGEVGDVVSSFKPTAVVGRTKEEVETEAAAAAGQLRAAQEGTLVPSNQWLFSRLLDVADVIV